MCPMNLDIPNDLEEATNALAENLSQSEPFLLYQLAKVAIDDDLIATQLIQHLSKAQSDLRSMQMQGGDLQKALEELRSVQSQVQANKPIMSYAHAQQNAIAYVRQINQEISQLLGVDFGALTRRSCC